MSTNTSIKLKFIILLKVNNKVGIFEKGILQEISVIYFNMQQVEMVDTWGSSSHTILDHIKLRLLHVTNLRLP